MKGYKYTIFGLILAVIVFVFLALSGFDLIDILKSLEEWEVDELLLVSILIFVGLYMDIINRTNMDHRRKTDEIYKSTMGGVSHIVNNMLNNMTLIELEADEKGRVSEVTMVLLKESIDLAAATIKELSHLDNIDPDEINRIAFSNVRSSDKI